MSHVCILKIRQLVTFEGVTVRLGYGFSFVGFGWVSVRAVGGTVSWSIDGSQWASWGFVEAFVNGSEFMLDVSLPLPFPPLKRDP